MPHKAYASCRPELDSLEKIVDFDCQPLAHSFDRVICPAFIRRADEYSAAEPYLQAVLEEHKVLL